MRVRYAIIGAFVTATLLLTASTLPALPAFIDTANFANNTDAPVEFQITKVSGIGTEVVCIAPGDSDSSHFIQKVKDVAIFFDAGQACRYGGKTSNIYRFFEPETTYTVTGKGHCYACYRVSVHH